MSENLAAFSGTTALLSMANLVCTKLHSEIARTQEKCKSYFAVFNFYATVTVTVKVTCMQIKQRAWPFECYQLFKCNGIKQKIKYNKYYVEKKTMIR